jgi:uncharacterized protein (DUF4415 family)
MADDDTREFSLAELRARRDRGETRTSPDAPARAVDEAFWRAAAPVVPPRPKVHTGLRIDADVLDWFKGRGRGWQTRINAVLRSYVEHQQRG